MLPAVAPEPPRWRRHAPMVAYALALLALVVALARPQVATSVPVEQARIILVTDQSGSMAATDVAPTRLARGHLRPEGLHQARARPGPDRAITFNKIPRVIQGPTTDRESLINAIESIQVKGKTATGDALKVALKQAQATPVGTRPPPAAIVLLSDGKQSAGERGRVRRRHGGHRAVRTARIRPAGAGGARSDVRAGLDHQFVGDPSQRQMMIRVPQVGAESGASLGSTAEQSKRPSPGANLAGSSASAPKSSGRRSAPS